MKLLTATEQIEMRNTILEKTAPFRKARALLLSRYGKPASVQVPGGLGVEAIDIILPPEIARVDSALISREGEVTYIILKEYDQVDLDGESGNGWD